MNLLELPNEVLAEILNRLDYKTIRKIRLTNSRLKALTDEYVGFSISFDENDTFEKFCFARGSCLKKIKIQTTTDVSDIYAFITLNSAGTLFYRPYCLESVKVTGVVSGSLLSYLVVNGINVKNFEMIHQSTISGPLKLGKVPDAARLLIDTKVIPSYPAILPKCKTVKLFLSSCDGGKLDEENTDALLCLLNSIKSENLKKVVFQGWASRDRSLAEITALCLQCLARNKTVKEFFFGTLIHNEVYHAPDSEEVEKLNGRTKKLLDSLGPLVELEKLGIFAYPKDLPMWNKFFCFQTKLTHLSLSVDLKHEHFSSHFESNWHKNLKQLVIRGVFLDAFDCSWIQESSNLQELCLQDTNLTMSLTPVPKIKNVEWIPGGVLSLILYNVTTLTADIHGIVERLKLTSLVLHKVGSNAGVTGVDIHCLRKIFHCPSINSLLLFRLLAKDVHDVSNLLQLAGAFNRPKFGQQDATTLIDPSHLIPEIRSDSSVLNYNVLNLSNLNGDQIISEPEVEVEAEAAYSSSCDSVLTATNLSTDTLSLSNTFEDCANGVWNLEDDEPRPSTSVDTKGHVTSIRTSRSEHWLDSDDFSDPSPLKRFKRQEDLSSMSLEERGYLEGPRINKKTPLSPVSCIDGDMTLSDYCGTEEAYSLQCFNYANKFDETDLLVSFEGLEDDSQNKTVVADDANKISTFEESESYSDCDFQLPHSSTDDTPLTPNSCDNDASVNLNSSEAGSSGTRRHPLRDWISMDVSGIFAQAENMINNEDPLRTPRLQVTGMEVQNDFMIVDEIELGVDLGADHNQGYQDIMDIFNPEDLGQDPNLLVNFILDAAFEIEGPPDFMGLTKRWLAVSDNQGSVSYILRIKIL